MVVNLNKIIHLGLDIVTQLPAGYEVPAGFFHKFIYNESKQNFPPKTKKPRTSAKLSPFHPISTPDKPE